MPRARPRGRSRSRKQTLRFSPYAWAKLLFLRDIGDTEVGMFGITPADDLLLIEDVCLVRQTCTSVTVDFDDAAVADHFDQQVDLGRTPEQFARIWLHSHPGDCPRPSGTDEETFARVFGPCEWAVMFIIARGGATYTRLRFNVGPTANKRLAVAVDYETPFAEADHDAWAAEYEAAVQSHDPFGSNSSEWLRSDWSTR